MGKHVHIRGQGSATLVELVGVSIVDMLTALKRAAAQLVVSRSVRAERFDPLSVIVCGQTAFFGRYSHAWRGCTLRDRGSAVS